MFRIVVFCPPIDYNVQKQRITYISIHLTQTQFWSGLKTINVLTISYPVQSHFLSISLFHHLNIKDPQYFII